MTTEKQIRPVMTWPLSGAADDEPPSAVFDDHGRFRVWRDGDSGAPEFGWMDPAEAAVQWDGLPRRMTVRFDLDVLEADLKQALTDPASVTEGELVRCLSLIDAYRKSQGHAVDDEPLYDRTPGEPVPAGDDAVDIVFAKVLTEGPPRYEFVEVEDAANGRSLNFGEWVTFADANGFARLRIPVATARQVRDVANPVTDWAWTGRPMDRLYARWVLDDAESNTIPALLEAARVCGVDARPFVLRSVAFDTYEVRIHPEDDEWEQARQYVTGLVDRDARQPAPIGVEARCMRCGETCNPTGPDDVTHLQREDGTDCGGRLQTVGEWHSLQPTVLCVDVTGTTLPERIVVHDGDVIVVRKPANLSEHEEGQIAAALRQWETDAAERLGVNVKTMLVDESIADVHRLADVDANRALDEITHVLSAEQWSPDTPERVAAVIDRTGRTVSNDTTCRYRYPETTPGEPCPVCDRVREATTTDEAHTDAVQRRLSSPLWQDEHDLLQHVYKVHGFGGDLTGASMAVIDDAHRRCHREGLWTWCDEHDHLGESMPGRLPIDCTGYLLDPDPDHTTVHVEHDGPCPVHDANGEPHPQRLHAVEQSNRIVRDVPWTYIGDHDRFHQWATTEYVDPGDADHYLVGVVEYDPNHAPGHRYVGRTYRTTTDTRETHDDPIDVEYGDRADRVFAGTTAALLRRGTDGRLIAEGLVTADERATHTRSDGDVTVTTRADSASGTRAPWRDGTEVAGEQRSGREGTDLVADDRIGRNEPPLMPLPVMGGSLAWDAHLRDAHGVTTSSSESLLVLVEVHRVEHRDDHPMRFPHCHAPDVPELVQVNAREHGTAIPDPLCTGMLVQTVPSGPGRLAVYELRHDRTCPVHERAVFGEVSMGAVVTVVVRDGVVTDVRIMPDQGRSSMHPLTGTGHDALLDVVDGTTWAPLENLPDGLHWDV